MQEAAERGHQGVVGLIQYVALEQKTGIYHTKVI